MARYDVHAMPGTDNLLIDVQSDLLENLATRIVVPLIPATHAPKPADRLNLIFDIDGTSYVMTTQFLSAIRANDLGDKRTNLGPYFAEITAALDMLFQGF